jgi:AcrR family transcriptional regulator
MGIHERKEREKEQRRDDILEAAKKVFFEKGLSAATMDEIAEAVELSKGTLYLYFSSKEDLYLAVMMHGLRLLTEMFREVAEHPAPTLQKLVGFGDAYAKFSRDHNNYFRMFLFLQTPQFHKQVSDAMTQSCHGENQKLWGHVISVIQHGMNEGFIRPDLNPVEVGIIFWSSSTALLSWIDTEAGQWQARHGIDLWHTLAVSNRLLFEATLTERGRAELLALNLMTDLISQ